MVALIDPGATTLVTDPEKLLAVQRDLGVALHAPVDAVAPGLLPEDRLFPVGVNGLKASADAVPASYRLLPEGQAVQRAALSDLKTSQVPASIERLRGWLTGSPARAGSWPGDHSAVAAVHHALYDTLPGGEVDKLLSSPRPVSLGTLQELLRGRLASLDPGTVWSEFSAGRAAAALIHGWPDGDANPRAFWLVRDPGDGRMYWADPWHMGSCCLRIWTARTMNAPRSWNGRSPRLCWSTHPATRTSRPPEPPSRPCRWCRCTPGRTGSRCWSVPGRRPQDPPSASRSSMSFSASTARSSPWTCVGVNPSTAAPPWTVS